MPDEPVRGDAGEDGCDCVGNRRLGRPFHSRLNHLRVLAWLVESSSSARSVSRSRAIESWP